MSLNYRRVFVLLMPFGLCDLLALIHSGTHFVDLGKREDRDSKPVFICRVDEVDVPKHFTIEHFTAELFGAFFYRQIFTVSLFEDTARSQTAACFRPPSFFPPLSFFPPKPPVPTPDHQRRLQPSPGGLTLVAAALPALARRAALAVTRCDRPTRGRGTPLFWLPVNAGALDTIVGAARSCPAPNTASSITPRVSRAGGEGGAPPEEGRSGDVGSRPHISIFARRKTKTPPFGGISKKFFYFFAETILTTRQYWRIMST